MGRRCANGEFSESARNAIAKISQYYLPTIKPNAVKMLCVLLPSIVAELSIELSNIKLAIKQQNKAAIHYTDAKAKVSSRVVWPMLIGLFGAALMFWSLVWSTKCVS